MLRVRRTFNGCARWTQTKKLWGKTYKVYYFYIYLYKNEFNQSDNEGVIKRL